MIFNTLGEGKMKKAVLAVLAVVFVFVLADCASSSVVSDEDISIISQAFFEKYEKYEFLLPLEDVLNEMYQLLNDGARSGLNPYFSRDTIISVVTSLYNQRSFYLLVFSHFKVPANGGQSDEEIYTYVLSQFPSEQQEEVREIVASLLEKNAASIQNIRARNIANAEIQAAAQRETQRIISEVHPRLKNTTSFTALNLRTDTQKAEYLNLPLDLYVWFANYSAPTYGASNATARTTINTTSPNSFARSIYDLEREADKCNWDMGVQYGGASADNIMSVRHPQLFQSLRKHRELFTYWGNYQSIFNN